MQYEDCSLEALTGEYRRELGHVPTECIHPIIAALFLPKFNVIENHFLFSNITNIIKTRYANEPLLNKPDYELFYQLSIDTNDIICDGSSTMMDLYNRALLQTKLWKCVLNLRAGNYYNTSSLDFINAIDICRINKFDNPDIVYGRNDFTVIKSSLSKSLLNFFYFTDPISLNIFNFFHLIS